jgi:hypothetical protein
MTRAHAILAASVAAIALQSDLHGDHQVDPSRRAADLFRHGAEGVTAEGATAERHHYTIGARVRPLLVFWIARSGVGDAVVTRRSAPGAASYSLLIGSDPDRTPMHINRWGYIEEEIRGAESRLLGLMTESEEESIQQAEANVRKQSSGAHPFKVIHATADGERSQARVASINMPEDYTLRQIHVVLDIARRAAAAGTLRVVQLGPGTRPGFLAALADAMRSPAERSIPYVYYGKLYELRRTRSTNVPNLHIGQRACGPAVAADFVITNSRDGEQTKFSMTYGIAGAFAEVPLIVTYQPRWWMQVELTIDDAGEAPAVEGKAIQ